MIDASMLVSEDSSSINERVNSLLKCFSFWVFMAGDRKSFSLLAAVSCDLGIERNWQLGFISHWNS